jgi:CheY-like chemotaxis protein
MYDRDDCAMGGVLKPVPVPAPPWLRVARQSTASNRLHQQTIAWKSSPNCIGRRARGGIGMQRVRGGTGVTMTEDLLSLRAMVVSHESQLCDLFRRAASISVLPTEIIDGAQMQDAQGVAAGGADLCYVDGGLPPDRAARLMTDLRAAAKPPFIALLAASGGATPPFAADGLADKPARLEEAKWLLDRSLRVRLVSRVLVIDDSATIRSIVRKTLLATRFAFEVGEAVDGTDALRLVRDDHFDVIVIDQYMPDTSGLECLAKIKAVKPDIASVIMTAMPSEDLAAGARALGAAFLKKPFFPADIENALCGFYGLRALGPKRI